jgi:predicted  nucleic acid-binding Zn-ribbon protein
MSKLEEKELKSLQENQNSLTNNFLQLGQVSRALEKLPEQKDFLNGKIDELEKKQVDIKKELEDKYGKISVNLQSGEFEIIPEEAEIVK